MPSHSLYHKISDGCCKHAVSDKDTRADHDARCRAHKWQSPPRYPSRCVPCRHTRSPACRPDARWRYSAAPRPVRPKQMTEWPLRSCLRAERTEQDDVERRRHVHAGSCASSRMHSRRPRNVPKALAQFSDILFHGFSPASGRRTRAVVPLPAAHQASVLVIAPPWS